MSEDAREEIRLAAAEFVGRLRIYIDSVTTRRFDHRSRADEHRDAVDALLHLLRHVARAMRGPARDR